MDSKEKLGTFCDIKRIRCKFPKNIFISYLNINSIRNKFDAIGTLVGNYFDILSIAETKLDSSFPTSQYNLQGFKTPYRLDISSRSGGILTFIRMDIPSRQLTDLVLPSDIQIIPIELNLGKRKWLLITIYRPPKQQISYFLNNLSILLDFYNSYDSIIINGDFNAEPNNNALSEFLDVHSLYNHMKNKTCWKSAKGTCIDLVISNNKFSIMNTGVLETGLSDHHLLIYTMLKSKYDRLPPKIIKYRKWKNFDEFPFKSDLTNALNCTLDYASFEEVFEEVLNRHAPMKTKFLRGNSQPHVTPYLRKAIMKRSKLKRRALLTNSPEDMADYKKQRNLVVNINRQAKKDYYVNITNKSGNQNFWNTVKPFFSEKSNTFDDRILLVDDGNIFNDQAEIAAMFNQFFNGITDSLELPKIPIVSMPFADLDPIDSIVASFDSHPSIINIRQKHNGVICSV